MARALFMAWLALAMLPGAGLAGEGKGVTAKLLRGEGARVREMLRLESEGARILAPVPHDRAHAAPPESPGTRSGRRIEVTSAKALAGALVAARPGDVIRIADGTYRGNFVAAVSGTADAPITLWGSRAAILDGGTIETGYGLHLRGDHWVLSGFSVRNTRKGIMCDGARHNRLEALEVSRIGEEGVHFRSFSSDNRLERSWIHDVGRLTPRFGEGVYIGSAFSNWPEQSGGKPDLCDRNRVIANLIGPDVPAECVDAKEGSSDGEVRDNVFLAGSARDARACVDLKGNRYTVEGNAGLCRPRRGLERPVRVVATLPGWGLDNVERNNATALDPLDPRHPFRAPYGRGPATLVLPRRPLPYSLRELAVRVPESIERIEPGVLLLHEHVLVCPDASLSISERDAGELRLTSHAGGFVSLVGVEATLSIAGTGSERVRIRSWDPIASRPDATHEDGRAYVTAQGGRMDVEYLEATDLGFGTGRTSGVAWKGSPNRRCLGSAAHSRFERNYFGAYTFECEGMRWQKNVFANNLNYGFDPHDRSDRFLVEDNVAFGNGGHGIIFSRGCCANVLRRNASYSNRGHGIMMDDGKVRNDGNPRHARAVPSNDNRIEENEVWDNEVGIAFEGGTGNVVRANQVHHNGHGVRLEGDASGNQVVANVIRASKGFAIYIYNHSDRNRIVDNQIEGGEGGVVVKRSVENVIERNRIEGIGGRGIVLVGRVDDSGVLDNSVHGRGSSAIDVGLASGLTPRGLSGNHTLRWMPPRGFRPALVIWATILLIPLVVGLPVRWKLRSSRRAPGASRRRRVALGLGLCMLALVIPATAGAARGQSLSVTAGLSSYFDDNILLYSRAQIRDLDSGLYPYRFGVSQVGDWVFHPSLGLLWQYDKGAGRRRSLRLSGEGDVHETNGVANVAELGVTWRESFAGSRRLTLSYAHAPDSYLRRLYDADLVLLPSAQRYRDASVDLHTGSMAWRQAVPRLSWLELTYRFDRTRYAPEFRERDSDTHRAAVGVAWERRPRASRLQLGAGYLKRDARAEDGGAAASEPDLSYHGVEMEAGGSLELARGRSWSSAIDLRYELELRRFDSTRPADESHFGRRDRAHALEIGLGARTGPHWSARGFYRLGDNRARYGANAAPGSEIGGYRANQAGIELEWTGELWRRSQDPAGRPAR